MSFLCAASKTNKGVCFKPRFLTRSLCKDGFSAHHKSELASKDLIYIRTSSIAIEPYQLPRFRQIGILLSELSQFCAVFQAKTSNNLDFRISLRPLRFFCVGLAFAYFWTPFYAFRAYFWTLEINKIVLVT